MNRIVRIPYFLVDVFSDRQLGGNSLAVAVPGRSMSTRAMQAITVELRQFETIFLGAVSENVCEARIFTMEEELGFAGHPLLGAAALLHSRCWPRSQRQSIEFLLGGSTVPVQSEKESEGWFVEMNQGAAKFLDPISPQQAAAVYAALGLTHEQAHPSLPVQVVGTGLDYMIVPVRSGIERARIITADFARTLASFGAKFVYVLDPYDLEGRTWDNDGRVEDIATGSAAGPAAAYLVRHGICRVERVIELNQGRFVGRPSRMSAVVADGRISEVTVGGHVRFVGNGELELLESTLEDLRN